jgi:hypothetical protein
MYSGELQALQSKQAVISRTGDHWRLQLPISDAKHYQLAQLDNYHGLARSRFPHRPPTQFSLRARASHRDLPCTWGFGFWNDPFGFSLGFGGNRWRLPALPNAAWFFFASPENHLALRDGIPGSGQLAAVFRSPRLPAFALAPATPLLALRASSRWLRKQAARVITQESVQLELDPTQWHSYALEWRADSVLFHVDDKLILQTQVSPQAPLSFVLWIDNQFAAWRPDGSLRYGVLPTQESWLETQDLRLN